MLTFIILEQELFGNLQKTLMNILRTVLKSVTFEPIIKRNEKHFSHSICGHS